MRILPLAALAALLSSAASAQSTPARVDRAEHHQFVLSNFRTESGVVLPQATVVYGTYGHLNAARDNVVLLPSHYMANHHGYEWLIGPGLALDTTHRLRRSRRLPRMHSLLRRALRAAPLALALQDGIAQGGANLRLLAAPGVTPLEGGVPIIADGKVIGAIGVSGAASDQDAQCAMAGIAAALAK